MMTTGGTLTTSTSSLDGRSDLRVRLRRDVTLLIQDDLARLLDLDRGRFYALNATGTRLLVLALECGPLEAIRRVADEHQIDESRVQADWKTLLGTLEQRHLIFLSSSAKDFRQPGKLGFLWLFAMAWLSLRLFGWAWTIRIWRFRRNPFADPCNEEIERVVRQFDQSLRKAASIHPFSPQCKERAIVAWHVLRNRWGLSAEIVVGVLAFPFQAHSWVEFGPLTLTDDQARCEPYTPAGRFQ